MEALGQRPRSESAKDDDVNRLVLRFGLALLDPEMPEARHCSQVIGIERRFRFRPQLLAKSFG
jgi:hypothetical protein